MGDLSYGTGWQRVVRRYVWRVRRPWDSCKEQPQFRCRRRREGQRNHQVMGTRTGQRHRLCNPSMSCFPWVWSRDLSVSFISLSLYTSLKNSSSSRWLIRWLNTYRLRKCLLGYFCLMGSVRLFELEKKKNLKGLAHSRGSGDIRSLCPHNLCFLLFNSNDLPAWELLLWFVTYFLSYGF